MKLKSFNITRFTNWLIPPKLRQGNMVTFIQALVTPLKAIYVSFTRHVSDIDYSLGINSQVVYMRKALNNAFDKESRRIEIEDNECLEPLLLWHYETQDVLDEDEQVIIHEYGHEENPDIYGYSKYNSELYTFNVLAPKDILPEYVNGDDFKEEDILKLPIYARMMAMIEKYRLAGRMVNDKTIIFVEDE